MFESVPYTNNLLQDAFRVHLIKTKVLFRGGQQHQSHKGSIVLSAITEPHSSHMCTHKHTHHSVQNHPTLYQRTGLCDAPYFNTFKHKTNIVTILSSSGSTYHRLQPSAPLLARFRSPQKDKKGAWLDLLWSCLNLNDNGTGT